MVETGFFRRRVSCLRCGRKAVLLESAGIIVSNSLLQVVSKIRFLVPSSESFSDLPYFVTVAQFCKAQAQARFGRLIL
ncbi:unnamed protein product [Arabidopsis halleri]